MKIMLLQDGESTEFPVISFDDKDWYRVSDIVTEQTLNTTLEVLSYYQQNPTIFIDSVSDAKSTLEPIIINDYSPLIPFKPLSYRAFLLYEEHYINAKRGFAEKYFSYLMPFINIYERVANRTFPKLQPEKRWYEYPIYHLGNHLNFLTDQAKVSIPPYTEELDYELELGAILCRPLKNATPEESKLAIGGFVIFNNFCARDVQADELKSGTGPMKAKNFANSISTVVVTADEILPVIEQLRVKVIINDELIIDTNTSGSYHSLAEAIAYASWEEQLHPGEFVATGAIPGCTGIENGKMLENGDKIRLEIVNIGSLENYVK